MKNYYEILEVNKKASQEIIEKAYKTLVKKYHPDLQTNIEKRKYAEKKIKDINEAYDVLSDEFLREQYDSELEKETMEKMSRMYGNYNVSTEKRSNNKFVNNSQTQWQRSEEQQSDTGEKRGNSNIGTFSGIVDLVKQLYHSRPKRQEIKEMTKKDFIAIGLTIVVVFLIGVILWFIPFTNGWMRELLFENPLFNWIGGFFS